jgi:NAD(P)-dependent dehydrogenase (short-subunit alcohol dehydrogenase family)
MSTGKIALVTGAGTGIGKAVATTLALDGFTTVLAGRRREFLEDTLQEIQDKGGDALVVPSDVTDPESVAALFSQIESSFGRLDLLFNNAGIRGSSVPLEELQYVEWKRIVDTNLTGVFLCSREAIRLMKTQKPRGGRIINNGSMSIHSPRSNSAAYTATKHAVTGLTRSISLDGRGYDIACGQIDIGNAATEYAARFRGTNEPLIRLEDAARAVSYMANLPLDTNVFNLSVTPTKLPIGGRG